MLNALLDSLRHLLSQWTQRFLSQRWFLLPLKKTKLPMNKNDPPPVLFNRKIINTITSSLQESETSSGLVNDKYDVPLSNILHEMGHIQGPKPIQFDNIIANGIITDTVVHHIYKAIDMLFYWLRDQCKKINFMFIGSKKTQYWWLSIKTPL